MFRSIQISVVFCVVCLGGVLSAKAVTLTTLYSFSGPDGGWPSCGLTLSGSTLYGATAQGGPNHDFPGIGDGTVFSLPVTGGSLNWSAPFSPSTGWIVCGAPRLLLIGSNLYGTTNGAGGGGVGTIFRVPVTGSNVTVVGSLNGSSGGNPGSGVTLSADGSTLYGTTGRYGAYGRGTVFSIPVGGGNPTALTSFNSTDGTYPGPGALLRIGSTLYGTTGNGGTYGKGTVFSLPVSGGSLTSLCSFSGTNGANPSTVLTVNGSTLYGVTANGGTDGYGTVFSLPVTGGSPTTLCSFSGTNGANPNAGLTLSDSIFYGATLNGGTYGYGTVFSLPVTGGSPTTLFSFNSANGANPLGDLTLSGSTLYGVTGLGSAANVGTVFALDITPTPEPSTMKVIRCDFQPRSPYNGNSPVAFGGVESQAATANSVFGSSGNNIWNHLSIPTSLPYNATVNPSFSNLFDSTGIMTNVGISFSGTIGAALDTPLDNSGSNGLENDYFVINGPTLSSSVGFTIIGLPANTPVTLSLYAPNFFNTDSANPVENGNRGYMLMVNGLRVDVPSGGYGSFVLATLTSDSSGVISGTWSTLGNEGNCSGMQLSYGVPEPSTLILLLAAGGALLACGWRKWRVKRVVSVVAVFCVACLGDVGRAMADNFGTGTNVFNIDFVGISGATNPTSGYGIVNNAYRVGKFEITNDQWNKFKTNLGVPVTGYVDATGDGYSANSYFTGLNVPTDSVSWWEAAQFVNWLNTSTGHQAAYKFNGTQGTSDYTFDTWSAAEAAGGTNLYRHKDAFYFLPTQDEWVKAAYWNGTTLQTYATKDNTYPTQGNGISGTGWNFIGDGDSAPYATDPHGPWAVGSGSEELNGTYDMMGNQYEWTESPYYSEWPYLRYDYSPHDSGRGLWGGNYRYSSPWMESSHPAWYKPTRLEYNDFAFRVASVPEPGSLILLVSGAIAVLAWAWRRRKSA